ncbi:unnamed protein product [Notodromas monacha]|uniref:NF-X1-type domain-containing protein n=1 Tax=Notodromas monacha TaxID=399045 RepID=A0A7R9BKN5_9CRUS|nr:unnamed protein product [Notodromas monacha]CAG0917244.1 unnamed protein product [Notodromas monacha]
MKDSEAIFHVNETSMDFRTFPFLPTVNDLLGDEKHQALHADFTSGQYLNISHYLHVQSRLMREDFIKPLREGVAEISKRIENDRRTFAAWHKTLSVGIYGKGVITGIVRKPVGVTFELKISSSNSSQVPWKIGRRLMYGSVLCLTNDNFKSVMFASIAERKLRDAKHWIVKIRPETDDLNLKFWMGSPEFLIVETTAFFESYRQIMFALRNIPLEKYSLKKYIVDAENIVSVPKYLLDHEGKESQVFPLEFRGRNLVGNPFSGEWPEPEELGLDKAQFRAFKASLCREFALIQGPPGTGKTFIGVKLVQAMLSRRQEFNIDSDGPILIMCFTQHVLDTFLKEVGRFTENIFRIGGQSRNELLMEPAYNGRNRIKKSHGYEFELCRNIRTHLLDLEKSLRELEILRNGVSSGAGILSVKALREFGLQIPNKFALDFSLANWLRSNQHPDNLSEEILKQILEGENEVLLSSRKASDFPRIYQKEDSPTEIYDFDLGIEDEASAETQRRKIESVYDDHRETVLMTAEQGNECIRRHFEIMNLSFEESVENAAMIVNENAKKLQDRIEDSRDVTMFRLLKLMKAETDLEQKKNARARFQADSMLLKVAANSELFKPPEELIGPEEDWINAKPKARWLIYRYWTNLLLREISKKIDHGIEKYERLVERYKEAQDRALLLHAISSDVVGLTTTAAAQNISLLQNIKAKIVVIEEAAEILESNTVCCLSSHCEHLILIGDQQFKPSTHEFQLAGNVGLDVSLFERMLKNGIPVEHLRQQHRMRADISNLIKLNVREDLQDHESVGNYDDILGIDKNVYFVSHNVTEDAANKELTSERNEPEMEAEFLLALCRYLLLQGYKHKQIAILAVYSEQLLVFKKLVASFPMCGEVRITSVDNYRGEETDIILLSFVRSNLAGNVGFSKTDNHIINVAMSRARKGLFMVGNMDALSSESELWRKMKHVLENENQIGRALPLRCQNHPDQIVSVFRPEEFPANGGCIRICNELITSCGHLCNRLCHVMDKEHRTEAGLCNWPCERKCTSPEGHPCKSVCGQEPCPPCTEKVERKLSICNHLQEMKCCEDVLEVSCPPCEELVDLILPCGHIVKARCHLDGDILCEAKCENMLPCGHPCPKTCDEPCGGCRVQVQKTIPDCSHSVTLDCSKLPERSDCRKEIEMLPCGHRCAGKLCSSICKTRCSVIMNLGKVGKCGHRVRLPCDIVTSRKVLSDEEEMEYCDHPCGAILSCGHKCVGKCSDCLQGRIHVPCQDPCGRKLVCGHICKVPCSSNCPPCREQCSNSCPHSACKKLCWELCTPCMEKCASGCPHKPCKRRCSEDCGTGDDRCNEPCAKVLLCHHKCVGLCGEMCPPCRECSADNVEFFDLVLNDVSEEPDARFVVLPECNHVMEVVGLDKWMRMSLEVIGQRVCPRCTTPIFRSRRYKGEINAALRNIHAVKKKFIEGSLDIHLKFCDGSGPSNAVRTISKAFSQEAFLSQITHEISRKKPRDPEGSNTRMFDFRELNGVECASITNCLDLLEVIAALLVKCNDEDLHLPSTFKCLYRSKLCRLARLLVSRKLSLNASDVKSIFEEIQRFNYSLKLETMRGKIHMTEGKLLISKTQAILSDICCFTDVKAANVRRCLEEAATFSEGPDGISHHERRMIMQAMGHSRRGQWFACPRGHIYLLAERWEINHGVRVAMNELVAEMVLCWRKIGLQRKWTAQSSAVGQILIQL